MPVPIDLSRVLSAYPPQVANAQWAPLGSAGGFSGAGVWRGATADGRELALKAHPAGTDPDRLAHLIHAWMAVASAAGLDFVPRVESTRDGGTVVWAAERLWDVCQWMPGTADFRSTPTSDRMVAAVTALARLHGAWVGLPTLRRLPCPAVARRWQALLDWEKLTVTGWRPRPESNDPLVGPAKAAWARLSALVPRALTALALWRSTPVPVQPCVCDVWHDHVLFTGDRVTGLIDYGAAKVDHVAVDLARLLGSLIPGESVRMAMAVRAYQAMRPLPHPELVPLLEWTGAVVGLTNWLRWLYHERRVYPNRDAVAARVKGLVQRLAG